MADYNNYIAQGLTPDSFNEMIRDAGAAFVELGLKGGESAQEVAEVMEKAVEDGKCLGATSGGFAFDFTYETRGIEVDGKKFEFVGSSVIDTLNASVSTVLKEVDRENLLRVISTSEYDEDTKSLKIRTAYTDESYIPELWFIMNRIGGGYVGIQLKNALNTEGANIQTNDAGEAELSVTFVGHQKSLTDSQYAPAQIYFFMPEEDEEGE